MRIYKIAEDSDCLPGEVEISIGFDTKDVNDVQTEQAITGHGEGTGCALEDDGAILIETMSFISKEKPRLTPEGRAELLGQPAQPAAPQKEKPKGPSMYAPVKEKEKRLDLGFGA